MPHTVITKRPSKVLQTCIHLAYCIWISIQLRVMKYLILAIFLFVARQSHGQHWTWLPWALAVSSSYTKMMLSSMLPRSFSNPFLIKCYHVCFNSDGFKTKVSMVFLPSAPGHCIFIIYCTVEGALVSFYYSKYSVSPTIWNYAML